MAEEPGKEFSVNDFYKFRIDMHNIFIYHPIAPEMEQ
tara:strand:+ start:1219 stop:1329 length:111 start_codon:yes stop_codon:yes gene_type:complete